ncbi:HTH domain-containing protein [Bacillaceae bacterium S4-13-58]
MGGKTSTKDLILIMLKKEKQLTVPEMAERLGITEMAVRRHLHTLEHDHFIRSQLVRKSMGRPSSLYLLDEKAKDVFPNHYQNFSLDILRSIEEMDGKEKVHDLLRHRIQESAPLYKKYLTQPTLWERIQKLAEVQENSGYMVELTENEQEYSLRQFNCPVERIAEDYQNLCKLEVGLFQEVLDHKEIKAASCIVRGEACCEFKIKKTVEN